MGLDVAEVSLVDLAANERDFDVVKSHEENMNAKAQESSTPAPNAAERVAVEVPGEGNPEVTKALEHVSVIVKSLADAFAPKAEADDEEPTAKGKKAKKAPPFMSDDDEDDAAKAKKGYTLRAAMKALLPDLAEAEFENAMKAFKKAGLDPDAKFQNQQPPVAKAADADAGPEPLTMDGLALAINKAKAFTPDRVSKMKAAFDILKLLLDDVGLGNVPGTSTPPLKTSPGSSIQDALSKETPTVKSADGGNGEGLEALISKALKPLFDRLDATDKEVNAIKSAKRAPEGEHEGGTTTNTKKSGSLWSGVL